MSDQLQEQMRRDATSLGWRCSEVKLDGQWRVTFTRGDSSIIATGADYALAWNTAYREAIRVSTDSQQHKKQSAG